MTSCIDYISLDQSVANYVGVCSTGKRKSHHYYIRHFLSWRTQWFFFFSPWEKDISCKNISSPALRAFAARSYPLLWFSFKDNPWERDRWLRKEGTDKESHPQNIFTMCSVLQKQLVWQNYVKTHRMLNFNASCQTTPYKIWVLPK